MPHAPRLFIHLVRVVVNQNRVFGNELVQNALWIALKSWIVFWVWVLSMVAPAVYSHLYHSKYFVLYPYIYMAIRNLTHFNAAIFHNSYCEGYHLVRCLENNIYRVYFSNVENCLLCAEYVWSAFVFSNRSVWPLLWLIIANGRVGIYFLCHCKIRACSMF